MIRRVALGLVAVTAAAPENSSRARPIQGAGITDSKSGSPSGVSKNLTRRAGGSLRTSYPKQRAIRSASFFILAAFDWWPTQHSLSIEGDRSARSEGILDPNGLKAFVMWRRQVKADRTRCLSSAAR